MQFLEGGIVRVLVLFCDCFVGATMVLFGRSSRFFELWFWELLYRLFPFVIFVNNTSTSTKVEIGGVIILRFWEAIVRIR